MKKWLIRFGGTILASVLITGAIVFMRFPTYFVQRVASGSGMILINLLQIWMVSFLGTYWMANMSYTTVVKRESILSIIRLIFQGVTSILVFLAGAKKIDMSYAGTPDAAVLEQSFYLGKMTFLLGVILLLNTDFRKWKAVKQEHKAVFQLFRTKTEKYLKRVQKVVYDLWLKAIVFVAKAETAFVILGTIVVSFLLVETFCMNSFQTITVTHIIENLLLYAIGYWMLWVLFRKVRVAAIIELALSILLGVVNYFTINFRGNPVSFGDILVAKTALSVAGGFKYTVSASFVIALIIGIGLILLFAFMKEPAKEVKKKTYFIQLGITYAIVIGLFLVSVKTGFLYGRIDAVTWNPKEQAAINGYLLSFVADTSQSIVEQPEEYDTTEMQMELENTNETMIVYEGEEDIYPNIIVIMNESLSDLSVLGELETDKEYLPYIQSLTEDTIYGNLYVSAYGGSTVYTEFEFLTGNSMAFLPSGSVPYIQYIKEEQTPSLAWTLKQQEVPYSAIAIHPYGKAGYNREIVYRSFGFDDFITEEEFEECTIYRKFITDEDDYKKVIEVFENKEDGQPLFIFNITMQNHGGYGERTDYTLREPISVTNFEVGSGVNEYLSSIKESDTAFEALIEYFEEVDEPTIILMFGDHQPQLEDAFYDNIFGKDAAKLTQEELMSKHCVPFVVWSNYQNFGGQYIENISPNYLSTMLLEIAGVERTGYQQYLSSVYQEYPVVTSAGIIDVYGNLTSVEEAKEDSIELRLYEKLQYNYLFEKEKRLDFLFY